MKHSSWMTALACLLLTSPSFAAPSAAQYADCLEALEGRAARDGYQIPTSDGRVYRLSSSGELHLSGTPGPLSLERDGGAARSAIELFVARRMSELISDASLMSARAPKVAGACQGSGPEMSGARSALKRRMEELNLGPARGGHGDFSPPARGGHGDLSPARAGHGDLSPSRAGHGDFAPARPANP